MKNSLRILVLLFVTIQTLGQPGRIYQVGDKMPDYTLINLINYKAKTAKISDFRGKILIFDYWGTGCKSCIESWPKLLKLQEKFNNEIQIITVNTHETETVIRRVLERQKKINNIDMTLPSVCGDTALYRLIPFWGVPHVVWIDQKGYIRSITAGDKLNEQIIKAIVSKQSVAMSQKLTGDQTNEYYRKTKIKDVNKPLFIDGNGENSKFLPFVSQSILTGRIEGVNPGPITLRTDSLISILTLGNVSVNTMYCIAYNNDNFKDDVKYLATDLDNLKGNRVIWLANDPKLRPLTPTGESNSHNFYYYQLTTKPTSRRRLQEMLQQDLKKYFGLEAHLEKRLVKCLILSAVDTSLMRYKGKEKYPKLDPKTGKRTWHNYPLNGEMGLIFDLSNDLYSRSPFPIIDETLYRGNVGGFEIIGDHVAFDKELQKYGMRFTIQEREIDMLVVSEPAGYSFPKELDYETDVNTVEWVYN